MVKYYKGLYYQGSLSDERADTILKLHKYNVIPPLKNVIVDIPDATIRDIIKHADKHVKATKDFTTLDLGIKRSELPIGTLTDMQTIGVAFQYYAESCIIGDEVGLGKTVQVAGYTNLMRKDFNIKNKKFRYLFLTEKASAPQIRSKMIQFTGDYVHLLPSATQTMLDTNLSYKGIEQQNIVGTHALLNNADFIAFCIKNPFDLIVIDESRILKERSSGIYKNMEQVRKVIPRVVLLNATPLENELSEFYNQLRILENDYVPNIGDFDSRYVKKKYTSFGNRPVGYKNEGEFRQAISLRYIARTREGEGATYLNNKAIKILVELSKEQKSLIRKTSLKSMTVDYPTSVDKEIPFNEDTTPKLGALLQLLEKEVRADGNSVLIYCQYRECQEMLQHILEFEGFESEIVNGDPKYVKNRQDTIESFNKGEFKILISNIVRGIDMDIANVAIFYSIHPNPQEMRQFVGRMTRGFNVNNKKVYMLISDGHEKETVEEKLSLRIVASKTLTTTGRNLLYDTVNAENPMIYAQGRLFKAE